MIITGSVSSTVQLRVNPRVLIGSTVKICPNDDYTLIFVCEATGIICSWTFDPFIETDSPLAIITYESGDVIQVNSVTVYITEKTPENTIFIRYISQLHISTKVLLDHESLSYQVVCDIDSETDVISITKPSKFSQSELITGW